VLDRFVADVRAGEGRALVVRGEPGVGKTALLDYLAARATGCLVARAAGVQSEMELAFAGLHQLCAPMLDHAQALTVPQREALRTALGLSAGPVPDRFLVGLAVVGLLSEAAGERPLVCVDDDQQWLDDASALIAVTYAYWAASILASGLGRYADAMAAAQQATPDSPALYMAMWALPELIEAAARTGNTRIANDAIARLAEATQAGGTDFGLGLEARSRALVSEGAMAESRYREAIDRLARTQVRPELARAHLLYGEWLRGENRRRDARAALRTAYDLFTAMGIEAFAERTRRQLLAAGGTVRKRTVQTASELTDQEAHIARLAVDGRTNVEIGSQLFLSTRTVEWHLAKVYGKLGVGSRRELRPALARVQRGDLPV
jgi:DNA-binding CsgD family transcriptional regulator